MNLSVVIPARNDLDNLRRCIDFIDASIKKPSEILIVDDASDTALEKCLSDKSVKVIRLERQSGPARARNIGAEEVGGDVILFIDSDVFINKDTINIVTDDFEINGESAVVGVFDDHRGYKTFFGDYKNLWMKYSYEAIPERAALFYTSLAAIKRDIFIKTGGFNENYDRPSTEDTAYGNILWNHGVRPLINPNVKAVHNKEYSLYGILRTDFYRASDLVKMKLRDDLGHLKDGNKTSVPKAFILSVFSTLMACVLFVISGNAMVLSFFLVLAVMLNIKFLRWLHKKRGLLFSLKSALFLPVDHMAVNAGMSFGFISYLCGNKY